MHCLRFSSRQRHCVIQFKGSPHEFRLAFHWVVAVAERYLT
jgi:hypothetical protein